MSGPEPSVKIWLARVALGAMLGAASLVLGHEGPAGPPLSILEPISALSFFAGAVLGWAGALGAAAGLVVAYVAYQGGAGWSLLFAGNLVVAAIGWAGFRWIPRIGRRFPNLRSFEAMLLAAAVASLAGAVGITLRNGIAPSWRSIGLFWASIFASIVLLVPPLLVWLLSPLRRWAAPIPGEVAPAATAAGLSLLRGVTDRAAISEAGSRWRVWPPWARTILATVAITLVMGLLGRQFSHLHIWLSLLYVVPILWAGVDYGIRGGLTAASLVGLCYLTVQPVLETTSPAWHVSVLVQLAGVVVFPLLGALWGSAQEREAELLQRLSEVNDRLRRELESVVRALRSALAAKDTYTEGHVRRVATYGVSTGRRLGLDGRDLELLETASLLHDIGKIGIPETILRKPGPLVTDEVEIMKGHPEIGARIVQDLPSLKDAAPAVRYHQERFDGRRDGHFPGYPSGLRGEEIPIGARIIAVVDAFDAMTSDRPYRRAMTVAEATRVLREERGGHFDPRVVDAFLAVLDEAPWEA